MAPKKHCSSNRYASAQKSSVVLWRRSGGQKKADKSRKKQMMDSAIEESYDDGLNEIEVADGLRLP